MEDIKQIDGEYYQKIDVDKVRVELNSLVNIL